MKVSIILPTFNEADNIVSLIQAILKNIPPSWTPEIIVVDDNSPDQTLQKVAESFADNDAVKSLLRTRDRGLAKSIRAGIESAQGGQILVMDTDFTHDPIEIPKMLHVSQVYDLVSGSRFCPGGRMQDTDHYLMSLVYNMFARIILRTQIQDNSGGYFTIAREKLRKLPFDDIFFGYGDYYFRLLHYVQKNKFTVVEIPAQYISRVKGNSKSNFIGMFFSYTVAILKLKYTSFRS